MAATRKVSGSAAKSDPNVVHVLRCDEVFADLNWNSRTKRADDTTDEKTGMGSRGFMGNVLSIAKDGQKTPVVVRPNPAYPGKGQKPYLLVSGFGRYEIITGLAAGEWQEDLTNPTMGGMTHAQAAALKNKAPTIRAFIRDLDEAEALEENLAENVQRDSLSGPDLAVGIMRLWNANPNLTAEQVAVKMNRNQSYVSRIKRIADGLSNVVLPPNALHKGSPAQSLLDAWRKDTIQLSQEDMLTIAGEKDATKKPQLYLDKRAKKTVTGKPGGKGKTGPGAWIENACDRDVPVMAAMLVKLQRAGFIEMNRPIEGKEGIAAFLSPKRSLPADVTEDQLDRLTGAIAAAVVQAKKEAKEAAMQAGAAAKEGKDEKPTKGKASKTVANGARA